MRLMALERDMVDFSCSPSRSDMGTSLLRHKPALALTEVGGHDDNRLTAGFHGEGGLYLAAVHVGQITKGQRSLAAQPCLQSQRIGVQLLLCTSRWRKNASKRKLLVQRR